MSAIAQKAHPLGNVENSLQPSGFQHVLRMIHLMVARSHQRRQLAKLDEHLLDDIGLSRQQVESEIAKPFWR